MQDKWEKGGAAERAVIVAGGAIGAYTTYNLVSGLFKS